MNSLLVRPSARQLLKRILDEAAFVAEVQALPPPMLAKLIDHIGLEDAGEIVALATAEQIERVFDEDLWKSLRPTEDEVFDAARFVVWLEILLEAGEVAAGRRLAELSEDTLTLAFHTLVVVVNVDELAADLSGHPHDDDDDALEKELESALSHEIGPYLVLARRHDGWDAILGALVALSEADYAMCERLLDRCVALSSREIDEADGDLHEVLSAEESLAEDVAVARAERRAKSGFVAPSDARSLLSLAKKESLDEILSTPRDPVTRAYFRELDPKAQPVKVSAPRLEKLLATSGVLEVAPPQRRKRSGLALVGGGPPRIMSATATLSADLATLAVKSPKTHSERLEELAFLVNVLISGATLYGRAYRPGEAAEAVLFVANAGLEILARHSSRSTLAILEDVGVVAAFRAGVQSGLLETFQRRD